MAEDLDDGELWLPSNIVPDVGRRGGRNDFLSLHHHHHHHLGRRHDLAAMEELATRLAAIDLLECMPPPPSAAALVSAAQRIRWQAAELRLLRGAAAAFGDFSACRWSENGIGSAHAVKPAKSLADDEFGLRMAAGRVPWKVDDEGDLAAERVFPSRVAVPAARERRSGTGVFLPRVTAAAEAKPLISKSVLLNNNSGGGGSRGSCPQKQQIPRRRNTAVVGRHENMPFHQPPPPPPPPPPPLSPVLRLPRDWSY